ncbi:hypothetical protein [Embleya sp. NPDC020886]|uniref:hypothetical protein n=1 Tax=Embleya sp. NPDC020886 TaxID=3363980 RepID=UPI0037A011C0
MPFHVNLGRIGPPTTPYTVTRTLTAGPVTLPDVAATIGVVRARGGRDEHEAATVAIELPAILELVDAVARGDVTPAQARAAFAPFVDAAAEYSREMDDIATLSWGT